MLHVLSLLLANGAALLAARALQRHLSTGQASLDAVLFLLLHLLLVSTAVLVLGLLGLLTSSALGVAGAAALGILLWRGVHKDLPRLGEMDPGRAGLVLASLLLARLAFQTWFLAPTNLDALSYQLPKIGEWVIHGRIGLEVGPDLRGWFPAGFELVEAWWVVLLHHDVLIEMAGIEFLLLNFLSARALASVLGAAPRQAFLAGLLYASTPGLLVQSTACMNDVAVAGLVTAGAALVLGRASPWILLLPVGLGAGVKPLCLFALPGLALLAILVRREPGARTPRRAAAVSASVLALVLGAFWYFRTLWVHGSVTYPVGSPDVVQAGVEKFQQLGFSLSSLFNNLKVLVTERIYDGRRAVNAMSMELAQWGVTAFSLGAVSLLALLPVERGLRRITIGLGVSLLLTLGMVQADSWNLRFTWFFPAVPAVAAALYIGRHRPVAHVASALVGFTLVSTLFTEDLSRHEFFRIFAAPGWRQRGLGGPTLERIPPNPVGSLGGFQTPAYLLYGPDFSRRVVYYRARSVDEFARALRDRPSTLLYADEFLYHRSRAELLQECVRRGLLKRIGDTYWYEPLTPR